MAIETPLSPKTSSWPISVGAEGIAAAQFARCGFDVLVQAGRDKPWYDLVVTRAGNLFKVSVKASDNGRWCLASGYTRRVAEHNGMRADCRSAIDMWCSSYGSRTVCCLVQFDGVSLEEMPRIYLASPDEIAGRMRETFERTGECTLFERYEWTTSDGACQTEMLPLNWHFSPERIQHLLLAQAAAFAAAPTLTRTAAAPLAAQENLRELALRG